jgi:hypothetical protein
MAATGGPMAEARTQSTPSIKFKDMSGRQKLVFVLKVTLCVISGGMIYPNVMSD